MITLTQIDAFLRSSRMAESRLGRLAAGDPALVGQMRDGRTIKPPLQGRIASFIAGHREASDSRIHVSVAGPGLRAELNRAWAELKARYVI